MYFPVKKKHEIDWNSIDDLKVKFGALRVSNSCDYTIVYVGKDLKIY